MSDSRDLVEARRLALGLTQFAVARELGITQPHYSKVMGGVANLPPELEERILRWLEDRPRPVSRPSEEREVLVLTRKIERNSRRLAVLLTRQGRAAPKRAVTRTRMG
jgi:transcriptional regulator with XRE-family HTH domain